MNESRTTCRICDSREIRPVLSLGTTPLADGLRRKEQLSQNGGDISTERGLLPTMQLASTAGNGAA